MHEVIDLILDRHHSGSKPGRRTDPHRLALAIEGGAMRGVVTAAMVCALEQLDLVDCFDAVYGSSAGAINGAFFLSRQARWGIRIYYEDINNRRFISVARGLDFLGLLAKEPLANVRFPVQEVLLRRRKLDFQRVLASPIPLRVVASSITEMRAVCLRDFTSREELALALQATSTMPGISGSPVLFRGDTLADALIFERLPLQQPILEGCTHILLLSSVTRSRPISEGWLERLYIRTRLSRIREDLPNAYERGIREYHRAHARAQELESSNDSTPRVAIVAPSGKYPLPGPLDRRKRALLRAAKGAYDDALQALGLRDVLVVEALAAFTADGFPCTLGRSA